MSILDHIRKLRGKGNDTTGPRAVVAAFGKHPGWDDHIADIGLNTDVLNACKTWLYVEGIRSLVDGGVWDELRDDERIDGYQHLFLQRTNEKAGGWLLGRLWSSTDGKGRSRYPMVVCIHATGVERDWMLDGPLRSLESLREQCMATKSADDVRLAVRAEEVRLQNSLVDQGSAPQNADQSTQNIYAELAKQSALGPDHQGLHRVMYQLDRDMSAYRSTGGGITSGSGAPTPRQLRVPAGDGEARVILDRWMRLMERELGRRAPTLLILPLMQEPKPWIDIIVGQPSGTNLKCMRSRPKHMPLVTDVPYQIEPEFTRHVEELIAGKQRDARRTEPRRAERSSATEASEAGIGKHFRGGVARRVFSSLDPRIARIGAPIAVVLLLTVVIAMLMRGGDPIAPELREQYATMHENWAGALVTPQNRNHIKEFVQAYGGDESLVQELDRIRRRYGSEMGLSAFATADSFTNEEEIIAALEQLREVRTALLALLERSRALAEEVDQHRGWRMVADELRRNAEDVDRTLVAEARASRDGHHLVELLSTITAASKTIESIEPSWRILREKKEDMAAWADEHNDAVVRQFAFSVREALADVTLAELSVAVGQWTDVAETLTDAANHWARVDVTHLRQNSDAYREPGELNREQFLAWSDTVINAEFSLLPEEADPRNKRHDELRRWHTRFHEQLVAYHRACGDEAIGIGPEEGDLAHRARETVDRTLDELESITWDGSRRQQQRIDDEIDEIDRTIAKQTEAIAAKIAQCESECEQRLATILNAGLPVVPEELSRHIESRVMEDWRQIAAIADHDMFDCLSRLTQARNMASFVQQLADRLQQRPDPPLHLDVLPSGVKANDINEIARSMWVSHISRVIDDQQQIDWNDEIEAIPLWRELKRAASEHQHWMSRALEMLADYREIEQRLNQCYGWRGGRGAADEEGIEPLLLRWHDSEVGAELRDHIPTLDELAEAAILLQWIEQDDPDEAGELLARRGGIAPDVDAPGLIAIAQDAGQWPAVRWAAWRALERYVDEPAFLEWERSLAAPMSSMLSSLDPPRREHLEQQFVNDRQRRWLKHAADVSDEDALEQAIAAMDEFDINAEELDGRLRLNYEMHSLRRLISKHIDATEHNEHLRRRIEEQTRNVRNRFDALVREDPLFADAVEIAGALQTILEFVPDDELIAGRGWNNVALARAGWQAESSHDDSIIRFHPPPSWVVAHPELMREEPVVFQRVRHDEHGASYLARSEMSAGLFIAAVEQRGQWKIVRRLLGRTHDADGADLRRGPRVWDWQRPADVQSPMVVNDEWTRLRHTDCYFEKPEPPSADHPMQHVSAGAAAYVSMLLGCRLMSEDEWRSAFEASGGRMASEQTNLRGRTWVNHVEHISGMPHLCDTPERGSFIPRDRIRELDREAAWLTGENGVIYDDGVLWFRTVSDFGDAEDVAENRFHNVIGNVWELTYERSDVWQNLTPARLAEQLPGLTLKRKDSEEPMLRVIGGSACSHPALGIDQTVPVEATVRHARDKWFAGFSDVGFRLAFSVRHEDLGMDEKQQFRQVVREQLPRLIYVTSKGDSRGGT